MTASWRATAKKAQPTVPEGTYCAKLTDISTMTVRHGPTACLRFDLITDDEWDGRQVKGLASDTLREDTKLGRWVTAILGHMPAIGEEISSEDILNRRCRVVIEHKDGANDTVFANVIQVLRDNG